VGKALFHLDVAHCHSHWRPMRCIWLDLREDTAFVQSDVLIK